MCPFIGALHNFNTSMLLHLKNFPIGTLGHLLPRLVLYSRNFPRRGPGTPWKLVASLPGPTEFGAAEPNALSLLASVTQEETYHDWGWCLPPTKIVIQVVLGMVYGISFTTLLANRVSFFFIYHFWTLPAVWCGFRHGRRSNWFFKTRAGLTVQVSNHETSFKWRIWGKPFSWRGEVKPFQHASRSLMESKSTILININSGFHNYAVSKWGCSNSNIIKSL